MLADCQAGVNNLALAHSPLAGHALQRRSRPRLGVITLFRSVDAKPAGVVRGQIIALRPLLQFSPCDFAGVTVSGGNVQSAESEVRSHRVLFSICRPKLLSSVGERMLLWQRNVGRRNVIDNADFEVNAIRHFRCEQRNKVIDRGGRE